MTKPPPPKPRTRRADAPAVDYAGAWAKTKKMIDAAIAAGTHSSIVRAVCRRCREWCDGLYHDCSVGGGVGVAGRMEICKACWAKQFPIEAAAQEAAQRARDVAAFRNTRLYSGDPT